MVFDEKLQSRGCHEHVEVVRRGLRITKVHSLWSEGNDIEAMPRYLCGNAAVCYQRQLLLRDTRWHGSEDLC